MTPKEKQELNELKMYPEISKFCSLKGPEIIVPLSWWQKLWAFDGESFTGKYYESDSFEARMMAHANRNAGKAP